MRYLISFLLLLLLGCRASNADTATIKSRTVILQPYTGISQQQVNYVYQRLSTCCPNAILQTPVTLPASAYNKTRNRYRADSLIHMLAQFTSEENITIGLTNKDISVTKGKHADWGIMGLAGCPGSACIASNYRLSGKNIDEQFFKISVHELGHTEGLPHCKQEACFMQDAEGTNKTAQLHDFCNTCKNHLIKRGWHLL